MSVSTNWRRVFALAAVLLLVSGGVAVAQEQAGNLYGTVTDNQGEALPGVRVEVTGIGAPRTQFSNAEGDFRFLGLDPGNYQLSASLEGFSSVEYPEVNVRVGRNTTIEVTLSPAVEEVITVTSESPLLDERKVSRGTSVSQIELEKIPTARDPWAIVTQTPGVLSDRINVGGNESGQQAVFTAPGVSDSENSFSVDGVIITDMAAIGASPTYYDFDQFEEMQVSTGGTDVEKVSSGASLNLVTKRGSNNPRGSARFLLTEDEQQFAFFEAGDVKAEDLEDGDGNGGLVAQDEADFAGSTVEEVLDFGFEAGGPVVRDRLWVWGSYGRNEIAQIAALTGIDDTTTLENSAVKVNGQPVSANSVVASWNRGDKIKIGRLGVPNRDRDASWDQDGPSEIWKVEDTHVFSSDFYLTGLYSYVDGGFQLQSKGGTFPSPITTTDADEALQNGEGFLDADNIWQNGWYSGTTNRDTDNFQVDGSYFFNTGNLNHELKFGASYRAFETQSNFGWAGGRNSTALACEAAGTCGLGALVGVPGADDLLLASRSGETRVDQDYTAGWIQDTLTSGNWTVNAGLRYDLQDGENIGSTAQANPLFPDTLPALDFGGNQGGCVDDNCAFGGDFEWETISPRLGVTYALGAERKTLLRASYSRFAEQLSSGNYFATNPIGINTVTFLFEDANDNNVFDVGEATFGPFGTPPGTDSEVDADLDPSITDELILGVEHAFLPEFVVGVDVTWRNTTDILEGRGFAFDEAGNKVIVTRDDFVPDETVGPNGELSSDGVDFPHLPDGTPWTTQFWRLRDGLEWANGSFTTNGDREVEYLGASLNFTKRLANRWMARGYVNYSDAEWDVPGSFFRFDDPTEGVSGADNDGGLFTVQSAGSGPFGDVLIESGWSVNLNGMYQVAPDRPWGFNVAGNFFSREGYPLPYFVGLTSSQTGDGIARSAGVTEEVDAFRSDDPWVVDLRLEKDMQFTDNLSGILSLDAFNVFDEQFVMQRDRELDVSTANHVTQNLAPRIYRLGFRLNWR